MESFDIKNILKNEYYKRNKDLVIGIDFTGHEQRVYNVDILHKNLNILVDNKLQIILHVGEEFTDESFKNV